LNKKIYLLSSLLVLLALTVVMAKVIYGGQTISPEPSRYLWHVDVVIHLTGKGTRAKVRLTLPSDSDRQRIYNEHFENDELVFYTRKRALTGNRIGFWKAELLPGPKSLQYTFSAQLKSMTYPMPANLRLPDDPLKGYGKEFQVWLDPSEFIQSKDPLIKKRLKSTVGKERQADIVIKKIYDFVRGEVKYRSEKGSKNAKEALKQLTADCGGQARLFTALSRAAGIPSRVVGGVILTGGVKNITHVWVENYIGDKWIPFDVVNGYYAHIPNHYLELYRGDYVLFKHLGLSDFNYFFVIDTERIPPVDNPWSLYVLPVHFQGMIKILLLVPLGALIVAFCRTIIGIPTFGTFTPILLAIAFRDISLWLGLLLLVIVVFLGWMLRKGLDQLKILIIPRLSIIVSVVIMLILFMMILAFNFNQQKVLFISLFPMVIMTWTIERFSVMQIEDGTANAFKAASGTAFVAVVAYYVMRMHIFRTYLFAFPELLLVIIAILLLLGRYTGIRLTELRRFQEFKRLHGRSGDKNS